MTRTAYDSTNANDIPGAPDGIVFAYNDGLYAQVAAVTTRFPGARVITISALGIADADVLDVEPGCVWPPANAVPWVRRQRARGADPSVYCGRANWRSLINAFADAGEPQPHYWTAHYTNVPHFCDRSCYNSDVGSQVAVATQYGGDLPGHFDISIVSDFWPGIDNPEAASGTGILIDQEETMRYDAIQIVTQNDGPNFGAVAVRGANGWVHVPPEINAMLERHGRYETGCPRGVNHTEFGWYFLLDGHSGLGAGDQWYSRDEIIGRMDRAILPAIQGIAAARGEAIDYAKLAVVLQPLIQSAVTAAIAAAVPDSTTVDRAAILKAVTDDLARRLTSDLQPTPDVPPSP